MNFVTIYDNSGVAKVSLPNHTGAMITEYKREEVEMASDTITISVHSNAVIDFIPGDYINVSGAMYRINQMPQAEKSGDRGGYDYTLIFESAKYDLANVLFLLPDEALSDYLTGDFETILSLIVDNANRVYTNQWAYNLGYGDELSRVCTIQFTEMNCLAALQKLCEEYDVKYRITESAGVKTIANIFDGSISGLTVYYGHTGGLYSIIRQAVSSENVVTKCFVYGSTDNLPSGYRHSRLCLPLKSRNESYLDNSAAQARYGVKEGILKFDDVKPSAKFQVSSIIDTNTFVCDELNVEAPDPQYAFKIDAIWESQDYPEWLELRGYNDEYESGEPMQQYFENNVVGTLKYMICGTPTITFNTGNLAGRSFEIREVSNDGSTIELVPVIENAHDPVLEHQFPDDLAFVIAEGDEFVISNIALPLALVEKAEAELEDKASFEFPNLYSPTAIYGVTFDPLAGVNTALIKTGDYIRVVDSDIGIDKQIRVAKYAENYLTGEISVELSDLWKIKKGYVSNRRQEDLVIDGINGVDTTNLTCRLTANYNGDSNVLNCSAGRFTNRSLLGREKVWVLFDRTLNLAGTYKYDIYIKASKKTNYAELALVCGFSEELDAVRENNGSANGEKAGATQLPADDGWSYLFKIGYITQPRTIGGVSTRSLVLDYGTATVTANDINSGALSDQNGNSVLDIRNGLLGQGAKVSISGTDVVMPTRMARHASNEVTSNANFGDIRTFASNVVKAIQKLQSNVQGNFERWVGKYDYNDAEDLPIDPSEFDIPEPIITDLNLS